MGANQIVSRPPVNFAVLWASLWIQVCLWIQVVWDVDSPPNGHDLSQMILWKSPSITAKCLWIALQSAVCGVEMQRFCPQL